MNYMTDLDLFKEVVTRLRDCGITIEGNNVCTNNGKQVEFNAEGYCLAYNLHRLDKVLDKQATFVE